MEEKIIAANGVNIYHYKQPNTHSVCISLYVKTGVLYENEDIGITHLLEHLHFRKLGGKNQRELYYKLESLGATFGACTYKEFVYFYLTASPKYFSELAHIAADLLDKLEVDSKDLAAEKRLVLSEIREDNQNNDIDYLANKFIWKDTNLQNPVLGSMASVKSFTLQRLQEEKKKVFNKENMFYFVTGCFKDEDITELKKEIEHFDLNERPNIKNDNLTKIPTDFKSRKTFVKLSHRKYYMHDVKITFDVDLNSVSRRELLYLDSILSEGLCSLLRAEMIEKRGLIYSLSSTIEQYNNIGVYYIKFTVHKGKLFEAIKSFVKVVKELKKGISEMDMQSTRVFKTDNQMHLLDEPESLNWTFAYENHILNNNYSDISELAEAYKQITKEQLVKIANDIFLKDNIILMSIGNKKGLSEKKLQEIVEDI